MGGLDACCQVKSPAADALLRNSNITFSSILFVRPRSLEGSEPLAGSLGVRCHAGGSCQRPIVVTAPVTVGAQKQSQDNRDQEHTLRSIWGRVALCEGIWFRWTGPSGRKRKPLVRAPQLVHAFLEVLDRVRDLYTVSSRVVCTSLLGFVQAGRFGNPQQVPPSYSLSRSVRFARIVPGLSVAINNVDLSSLRQACPTCWDKSRVKGELVGRVACG